MPPMAVSDGTISPAQLIPQDRGGEKIEARGSKCSWKRILPRLLARLLADDGCVAGR